LRVGVYRISTGCSSIDGLLGGGITSGSITLIYGEAETGKTSLAIQCAVNSAKIGYKTIFVDSDGGFTPERLYQIARGFSEEASALIIIMRPKDFREQAEIIDNLDRCVTERLGLVVIDTVTSLYRSALGISESLFALNRELNRQVATLAELSKAYGMPILLTSQVRESFTDERVEIEPVATRVLRFWSDVVIGLNRTDRRGVVSARVEKPSVDGEARTFLLALGGFGIRDYESQNDL